MAEYENGLPPTTDGSEGKISNVGLTKVEHGEEHDPRIRAVSIKKEIAEESGDMTFAIRAINIEKEDAIDAVIINIQAIAVAKSDVGLILGGFM